MKRSLVLAVLVCAGVLTACAPLPGESSASSATPAAQTDTPVPTAARPAPSAGNPSPSSSADALPPTPGIIGPPSAGSVTLHLADAWDPDSSWNEGSYQVPGKEAAENAIAAEVGCYRSSRLEYRFSAQSGTLTFTVAQALSSESSEATLEFKLLANGRTVDSQNITFDQTATLSTPLTGVSAVVLETQISASCNKGATAVVSVTQTQ